MSTFFRARTNAWYTALPRIGAPVRPTKTRSLPAHVFMCSVRNGSTCGGTVTVRLRPSGARPLLPPTLPVWPVQLFKVKSGAPAPGWGSLVHPVHHRPGQAEQTTAGAPASVRASRSARDGAPSGGPLPGGQVDGKRDGQAGGCGGVPPRAQVTANEGQQGSATGTQRSTDSKDPDRVSAGRGLISPAKDWWAGAGSKRRPSAFQADARTD